MRKTFIPAALLFAAAGIGQASTIFSDNFDSNPGQNTVTVGNQTNTNATGTFTVTSGTVDVVGPTFFPGLCATGPEAGSCIDLDGVSAGTITSTVINLTPGNYTLAFDIDGSQRGNSTSATVTFGSFFTHTYLLASADTNAVSTSFNVLSSGTAQIVFASNDFRGSADGALVDNVTVTQNAGVVPEPASAFLALGALAFAFKLRKRR